MKTIKQLGIWMDYEKAHFFEVDAEKAYKTIASEFDKETEQEALSRSENIMHNKRQQLQEQYFKKIGAEILKYDQVLLFGPTNAKNELHNYLNEDSRFQGIQVNLEAADKMTENEKRAFVRKFFETKSTHKV